MTTAASVEEFEALMTVLEPLAGQMRQRRPPLTEEEIRARLVAIARVNFEIVGQCPHCDSSVRRSDPRIVLTDINGDDHIFHGDCGLEARG